MNKFYNGLGIEKYAEFFNNFYETSVAFMIQTHEGFAKYNSENQPLTYAIRTCIVEIAVKEICGNNTGLKIKLAAVKPDFTKDTPWSVTGVTERECLLIESYLLSGLDAKTVSEEIVSNSKITPWRKDDITRFSQQA